MFVVSGRVTCWGHRSRYLEIQCLQRPNIWCGYGTQVRHIIRWWDGLQGESDLSQATSYPRSQPFFVQSQTSNFGAGNRVHGSNVTSWCYTDTDIESFYEIAASDGEADEQEGREEGKGSFDLPSWAPWGLGGGELQQIHFTFEYHVIQRSCIHGFIGLVLCDLFQGSANGLSGARLVCMLLGCNSVLVVTEVNCNHELEPLCMCSHAWCCCG